MKQIITGDYEGNKIKRTAYSDLQAFIIIGRLNHEGVTNICMREDDDNELLTDLMMEQQKGFIEGREKWLI